MITSSMAAEVQAYSAIYLCLKHGTIHKQYSMLQYRRRHLLCPRLQHHLRLPSSKLRCRMLQCMIRTRPQTYSYCLSTVSEALDLLRHQEPSEALGVITRQHKHLAQLQPLLRRRHQELLDPTHHKLTMQDRVCSVRATKG